MYYVYILKSTLYNRYYIGSSSDCEKRLAEHNAGSTKSTKPYRPWILIYTETHVTKESACKREWHLKHPKGYLDKLEILRKINKI